MNIAKKTVSVTLALLMTAASFSLTSCSDNTDYGNTDCGIDDGRLSVVATNFALYDFARSVCGDEANVVMLLPLESESHDFEATLGDIDKIASADLFIYTGGESEDWVEDVFATLNDMDREINSICAVNEVETYIEETKDGMQTEHEHDEDEHDEAETDEHIWTSIPNAVVLVEKICEVVSELEPSLSEKLNANAKSYIAELNEIDAEIAETVQSSERNVLVFADRFPFRYFTERYSLDYYAAFSGCTSNTEPTLSTVNFLIEKVKEESIPAVLTIEFSDKKCAEAVAGECGCEILELHSAHNVSREDFDSGVTYADLMRRNLDVIKTVLN